MSGVSTQAVQAEVFVGRSFRLGENPLWDERRQVLYWTDIEAGEVWCRGWRDRDPRAVYHGPAVGGFTLQEDGRLLLFRERDVVLLDPDQGAEVEPVLELEDQGTARFNDVIAAPDGSVFAGTIGRQRDSGGVCHLSRDGRLTLRFRGTCISNGMGFGLDGRTFYWTCTTSRTIYRFDHRGGGVLENRRAFVTLGPGAEVPDGLALDEDGAVWSARWDGARVVRHDQHGTEVSDIRFPVPRISSLAFGGADLRTLFVTAAEGPVYACRPGPRGRPEHRSRVVPAAPTPRARMDTTGATV
jgi:D-xylonolactonase